ncbi:DUF2189 domain-containing protein [Magnetospirillum sp. 64-120]|uniref:DUF2189 domain-containing protein n=1 Tax=Magnetospirillum sp. 64-120 TaxID=1895778 RepID=UPI00092CD5F0|nr:DUF2189 domain-containing protein [Magnetospirillum sp. 64-120]OJX81265.1 MAG: hypothetical protein BGO92_09475 [Magnetospirillum sp. 64-120]
MNDVSPPKADPALSMIQRIHAVDTDHVWHWLRLGWRDYIHSGWIGPLYGAVFAAIGLFIVFGLAWFGWPYLITPMIGGFLLIGPLSALGFYGLSSHLEKGDGPHWRHLYQAWRANTFHIMTAGLVLMLVVMIWARLSIVLFALFFPYQSMSLDSFVAQSATMAGISFTLFMLALGAGVAALVFVTTVVALPMMLDVKTDIFTAALVSTLVVFKNPKPMALWATTIAVVTGIGLLPAFLGLTVALPVIGHASWHAYRDLVGDSA